MSKISTFINLYKRGEGVERAFMENLSRKRVSHILPDRLYIRLQYYCYFNKKLNLDNPATFNEKLQWLKLYNRVDAYTKMVDKYEAKIGVARLIGDEYIIPTLGVWDRFEDINFDTLPDQFVIKCTHDSGCVAICSNRDEFDFSRARNKINSSLSRNFYYYGREWPYKNVKPRVIAETYIVDNTTNELRDYKFFCFNGKCKFFKIDFDRFIEHRANYYDTNKTLLELGEVVCPPDYSKKLDFPVNLDKMIELAEILSKGIHFLRVDFYEVNDHIYFGEMTFFPASGLGPFIDEKWDYELGNLICLPERR